MTNEEIMDALVERAKELGWGVQRCDVTLFASYVILYPPSNVSGISLFVHETRECSGIHLDNIGYGMGVEEDFRQLTGHDFPSGQKEGCVVIPLSIMNGMVWTTRASNG